MGTISINGWQAPKIERRDAIINFSAIPTFKGPICQFRIIQQHFYVDFDVHVQRVARLCSCGKVSLALSDRRSTAQFLTQVREGAGARGALGQPLVFSGTTVSKNAPVAPQC
jgi:hypothetical protein